MIRVLENEWVPWVAANKNGNGDGSGDIPEGALNIAGKFLSDDRLIVSFVSLTSDVTLHR